MPQLVMPHSRFQTSFLAAMDEFRAEGRGAPGDDSWLGRTLRQWSERWCAPEAFASFVDSVRSAADPRQPIPTTILWYVDRETYLGRMAIRHVLDDELRESGGHIGYDVRPSARGLGHATAMLRAALPIAHALAIDPALITCSVANVASRRVIERCGGAFEDQRAGKLRFWVPTGAV